MVVTLLLLSPLWTTPVVNAEDKTIKEETETATPRRVVARVNGVEINKRELDSKISIIIPSRVVHSSLKGEKMESIRKEALDSIIINELLYQKASKEGFKAEKREINKRIKELQGEFKEPLEDILKRDGFSMDGLRRRVERGFLIKKVVEEMDRDIEAQVKKKVTDRYVEDYYIDNKEKFIEPERMRLREIHFKADPGGGQKHWDEVRAKAVEVLKRVKAGEDFAELASEFSQGKYAKKGGDMGFVRKGGLMQEIEVSVEDLGVGEVAGPIWTMYGYHIVRLEEKAPPIQRKFEEVRKRLKKELEGKEFKKIRKKMIDDLKENAKIEYIVEKEDNK
jgi:hypothetical protein